METPHTPVLLDTVIDFFSHMGEGLMVDCTLGYGGHAEALLIKNPKMSLVACDKDEEAIAFSTRRLEPFKNRVQIIHGPFSKLLEQINISQISGILADIGVSSLQIDKQSRGFGLDAFSLDMRMDSRASLSAYEVVNEYAQEALEKIFREYGELKQWRSVAQKICQAREDGPIKSAKELAILIGKGPSKGRRVSAATLAFQAIRIEVNNELGELATLLASIEEASLENTRVGIITFHSLEDRMVKQAFKRWQEDCTCSSFVMRCECGGGHALGKVVTKKPITASKEELAKNSRASSAKLRIFDRKSKNE
ncbi:MAG: 16S rRNA (cytosine(1402)-N(4))-methyltransferase RsmH [Campylobacteraceae bacterium]|nr:16S rRNA (cytosine(1402)-N(4))-methyltransferase RsmH [Campylobacteraceae bacterium]